MYLSVFWSLYVKCVFVHCQIEVLVTSMIKWLAKKVREKEMGMTKYMKCKMWKKGIASIGGLHKIRGVLNYWYSAVAVKYFSSYVWEHSGFFFLSFLGRIAYSKSNRSSHGGVIYKKSVLKTIRKIHRKTYVSESFLINSQTSGLQLY